MLKNSQAPAFTVSRRRDVFHNWDRQKILSFNYKGRNAAGIHHDGKNTVSFVDHWPVDVPFEKIAYCMLWFDDYGYIIESDIILNQEKVRFTTLKLRLLSGGRAFA